MTGDTAGQARAQGPGTELSRERERQGLTRQQVAEQLNLDVNVIHWIENDDFAALGAPVFAKGHLRRYASVLGLPPEDLLAAYEQAGTQPSQPSLIPRAREDRVPERPPARWPWVIGGVAGALLLAAFVAFVVERWSNQAVLPTEPPSAAEPAPVDDPINTQSQDPPTAAVGTDPAPVAGQITLKLSFTEDTWVEVYDGSGAAVLYDLGGRGTERTLRATAPLSVTIGNPTSVAVFANGRRLTVPAATAGQSLTRFSIDAAGAVR